METSKLFATKPIRRADGRYYIPLLRAQHPTKNDKRSIITLRVTSDGFNSEEEGIDFARHLERAWNMYIDTVVNQDKVSA